VQITNYAVRDNGLPSGFYLDSSGMCTECDSSCPPDLTYTTCINTCTTALDCAACDASTAYACPWKCGVGQRLDGAFCVNCPEEGGQVCDSCRIGKNCRVCSDILCEQCDVYDDPCEAAGCWDVADFDGTDVCECLEGWVLDATYNSCCFDTCETCKDGAACLTCPLGFKGETCTDCDGNRWGENCEHICDPGTVTGGICNCSSGYELNEETNQCDEIECITGCDSCTDFANFATCSACKADYKNISRSPSYHYCYRDWPDGYAGEPIEPKTGPAVSIVFDAMAVSAATISGTGSVSV
jgi:hypothetical protein